MTGLLDGGLGNGRRSELLRVGALSCPRQPLGELRLGKVPNAAAATASARLGFGPAPVFALRRKVLRTNTRLLGVTTTSTRGSGC